MTLYFTLFFCIGTIALVDLRVMGIAGRNQTIVQLAQQVLPWTWTGFALVMISGSIAFCIVVLGGFSLFSSTATLYIVNPAFRYKLGLFVPLNHKPSAIVAA